MEAKNEKWEQYFKKILDGITDQEFDALLEKVEPFSHVGPDVMQYLQYTEPFVKAEQKNTAASYSFERQTGWYDANPNPSLAA